jgi:hypothetical protein
MNNTIKDIELTVIEMRKNGNGYKTISNQLGIKRDKVRYYCQKNNLSGFIADKSLADEAYDRFIYGFNDKHGDRFIYLSGFLNSESPVLIKCRECGSEFTRSAQIARKDKQLTCDKCKSIAIGQNDKERKLEIELRRIIKDKEKEKALFIKQQERAIALVTVCNECGGTFTASKIGCKYCSIRCSNRHENRARELKRRNKILNNGHIDKDISLERLVIRDNNTCHICGVGCDINDYVINEEGHHIVGSNYPSIDHVLAINNGGTHTWNNIKLAHHYCNTIKSDKTFYISGKEQFEIIF